MKSITRTFWLIAILTSHVTNLFGKDYAQHDTTTKLFSHTIELGANFRIGQEDNFIHNDYDHQTVKANNFIIGLHTQFLNIRISHLYNINQHMALGVAYGANMYFHIKDFTALLPVMAAVKVNVLKHGKLRPFITERLGYAFLLRNRKEEYIVKAQGIEGGATNEMTAGLEFHYWKKLTPILSLGYTFQHIHSKRIYELNNSLASQAGYTGVFNQNVTETSNGIYHFIYLTIGLNF